MSHSVDPEHLLFSQYIFLKPFLIYNLKQYENYIFAKEVNEHFFLFFKLFKYLKWQLQFIIYS